MLKYIFYLLIIIQFAYSDSKSRIFYSLNYSNPYFSIIHITIIYQLVANQVMLLAIVWMGKYLELN